MKERDRCAICGGVIGGEGYLVRGLIRVCDSHDCELVRPVRDDGAPIDWEREASAAFERALTQGDETIAKMFVRVAGELCERAFEAGRASAQTTVATSEGEG